MSTVGTKSINVSEATDRVTSQDTHPCLVVYVSSSSPSIFKVRGLL